MVSEVTIEGLGRAACNIKHVTQGLAFPRKSQFFEAHVMLLVEFNLAGGAKMLVLSNYLEFSQKRKR